MTIDKAERLRLLDAEKEFNMCGISGRLLSIELSNKDYSFLFTEAERAQELEKGYKGEQTKSWYGSIVSKNIEMKKENKRLREALEFYASRKNYNNHIDNCEYCVPFEVFRDYGEKARQALEAVEDE